MATAVDSTTGTGTSGLYTDTTSKTTTTPEAADRFLKLLVAQMQHQDPLNPMDNAEVTTQMAQIQTVSGIEKLNKSITAMSESFSATQALQSIGMVGREVTMAGNGLRVGDDGTARGGYLLDNPAERVLLEVYSAAGAKLDSVELGASDAGRRSFTYTPSSGVDPNQVSTFRITAFQGTTSTSPTTLMHDKVTAVVTAAQQLTLDLQRSGSVPYSNILSIH